jgi:hypothetical protein
MTASKVRKVEREKSAQELGEQKAERAARLAVVKAGGSAAQLPLWEDWQRGIPNDITRTSLFTSRNNNQPRRTMKGEPVFAMGEIAATYRGEELRQDDERVWMQILHLARLQPLSEFVEFIPGEFMLAIGWKSRGSREYDRLREILSRLQATALQISSKRLNTGVSVSLIVSFQWRGLTRWRVKIEPEMKQLFPEDYYTRVQWEQRLSLPSGIASKLHSYFASHRQPLPVKVCHLQELCGSQAAPSEFRKSLRAALDALVAAGFLLSWRFGDDETTVEVRRAG